MIRFEPDGFLESADGSSVRPWFEQDDPEVDVGVSVIRPDADGFLKMVHRLVSLAFLVKRNAELYWVV